MSRKVLQIRVDAETEKDLLAIQDKTNMQLTQIVKMGIKLVAGNVLTRRVGG